MPTVEANSEIHGSFLRSRLQHACGQAAKKIMVILESEGCDTLLDQIELTAIIYEELCK